MPIDRTRLTKEEAEELRRALNRRRSSLLAITNGVGSDRVVTDASWRLFVVESLLYQLGEP